MIALPSYPPRRAWLTSFGLVMGLAGGLLAGILLALLPLSRGWFTGGVVLSSALVLCGLIGGQAVSLPYRAWNKLARGFARYSRLWVLGVYFYIFFMVVGRTGSFLRLARPLGDRSLWEPWNSPTLGKDASGRPVRLHNQAGWIRSFVSSAMESRNGWTLCLLPFLMLLSILQVDHRKLDLPTDIYTLY